jgi:hypothetical protein
MVRTEDIAEEDYPDFEAIATMAPKGAQTMSDETTQPGENVDQLRHRKELAELKAQIAALTAPWWRRAGLITIMTTIVAAVMPVTKIIEEHYQSQRELALQEAKQANDIRVAYLDRAAVPGQRLRTLRFLIGTSSDRGLVAWAEAEKLLVEKELASIDQQLADLNDKISKSPLGALVDDLKKQVEDLKKTRTNTALTQCPACPMLR